ncbi:MAG: hypothetical protein AMJ88_08590 [Anaerolineae bacterium SM23_ 63]|nr:MAG: hypothetical protein AMJ88_08590 [Anaerolineae bacterium SM23_ 63]HEY48090.1 mechanosensitive ion channel [Anaerolineae bacterium]
MIDTVYLQDSISDLWDQVIAWLPTILVVIILLILGWLFARLISALTQRLLRRLRVDGIFERVGLAEGFTQAGITRSASELIGLVIFWLVFLGFILLALEQFGLMAVVLPLQGLIGYLPRLLAAALVLIVGAFLAQFLGRVSQATAAGMGIEFHQPLGQFVQVLLLVVSVILAVDQLGLNLTLLTETFTNLVTVFVAGLVLSFALGARGVAGNILAGYYAREQFPLGELIVIDNQEGTLEAIGTLSAEIALGEDRIFIPNARMIESQVWVRSKSKSVGSSEGS